MKVHKRISLGGEHGDKFRGALVMSEGDGESVTLDVESIGLRFYVSITSAQARELGLALIEAAGAGDVGEKASG